MLWIRRKKSEPKLIWVRPKNYRRIALYTIENCARPIVWVNGRQVNDFSEKGPLIQKVIRRCIDFLIKDGDEEVLGFHDHPDHMWVTEKYKNIAEYCASKNWLKVKRFPR